VPIYGLGYKATCSSTCSYCGSCGTIPFKFPSGTVGETINGCRTRRPKGWGEMADIIRTYQFAHRDGGSGSVGTFTTDNFPQGVNVYASIALSVVKVLNVNNDPRLFAFISKWSVYGPQGQINPGPTLPTSGLYTHSTYINNCANITFGVYAGGGEASAQITIFQR
jgi:hypothetical protein